MTVIAIERQSQLTGGSGLVTQRGAEFLEDMTRQLNDTLTIQNIGSPEGVISASAPRFYFDTANGDYYKKTGTGTSNTGWVLI